MADTASLKISVDSRDVKNSTKDLDNLSKSSSKTEQSANKLTTSFKGLGIAVSAVASSLLVTKFIEMADATTNVNNQLKLVTKSTLELKTAQDELFKISQKTRQSYSETAGTYSNFALSMQEMGKSQKEVLRTTETVNKAVAISGGTAQQAAAAIQQLGQAFGSGVLAGDELKSILENSKGLAKAIADGMGVSIGKLRTLGADGKITAEVLAAALEKSAQSVDDKFSKMTATVEQSLTTVKNSLQKAVGSIDDATGVTKSLADSFVGISQALDTMDFTSLQEALPIVKGLVTTFAVMYSATKAASIAEGILASIREKAAAQMLVQNKIQALKTAMQEADTLAIQLGTYAQNARRLADEAATVAMETHSIFAIKHSKLLATEAATAEAAAIAQTAHARALQAAGFASAGTATSFSILGTAMKAIPFVAVASTVALLATSFFDASKDADTLTNALNATNDELEKLTENQLKSNKISLSKAYTDSAEELSKAVNKRRFFDGNKNSKEFIALKAYEDTLRKKHQDISNQIELTNKIINKVENKADGGTKKLDTRELDDLSLKLKDEYYKNAQKKGEEAFEQDRKDSEEAAKKAIKAEEDRQKKLHDIAQSQLKMIQEDSDKKIKAEEDYQERLSKLEVEKIDKFLRVFEDMKPPLQKLNEEVLEEYNIVEAMFGGAENIPQEFFDMLIVKFEEFHDKAKKNLDFSIKIDFDTEGENKAVLKIAKSMERLADETKQYEKNLEIANGDVALIAKAESEHSKNQIAGYANISGAMSEMFDEGSKEAAAFKAIESGLAVVAGVRAIMTAGTGDPYTAIPRMAAMAAMVASTLQSAGIAFGVGGVTTSSDAFSALESNNGTGSVLGDAAAQSKSMERSLDILSEYARPEFSLLSQMNKSLISIDEKIGGFASLLIREGGFAFGEGYEGFDTGSQLTGAIGSYNSFLSNTQTAIVDILTLGLDKKLFGGAISGLLNGITGSIMGGLFGKTSVSQTMTDSGIYFANTLLTTAIEDFNGAAYQTISTTVKKKSWFSSSSKTTVATYFAGLDDELENQFSLVLSGLYETTLLAGEALDTSALDVEKSLENFVVSIGKISLKGKTGDQIQETLEAIFGEIGDDIARTAFPLLGDFQKVGEGMYETMTRVATGMEVAEYYIDRLGKGFDDIKYTDILNKQGDVGFEALSQSIIKADEAMYGFNNGVVQMIDSMSGTAEELYGLYTMFEDIRDMIELTGQDSKYLTSSMILGAGSTEELMAGMDEYFENFLSEEEQLAYKTEAMAKEFAKLDLVMPTTSDGFKDLIKGLDLTSEAGQELYGRAIVLSEGFHEVIEASEGLKSSLFDNIQNFIDSVNNTLLPKSASVSFYEFTSSFNDMIDAIASGSSDMLDIGNTALENAKNYLDVVTATAASSYDIDFAKAMLVNKFSGVVATPDASLTTINNTLNSNNAVLIQELQSLKFELKSIKDMAVTQTATQISTLSTQRAILGNVAV